LARGHAKESSDLDLLVEWEPGHSLFDHAQLKLDLEEMLERRVDIGTERSLSAYIRRQAIQEAAPQDVPVPRERLRAFPRHG
jgi:predicted nucleotidyltransferase